MTLFADTPGIMTNIIKKSNGTHTTQVIVGGVVVRETPTPVSQIRPARTSCLWRNGMETGGKNKK